MNCAELAIAIGDYVDGAIAGEAALRLQTHLHTCARCAGLEADLRAIRDAARTLPAAYPAASVWTAIAAAAADRHAREQASGWWRLRSGVAAWHTAWQPLAAGAMAVVLTTALISVGGRLEPLRETAALAGSETLAVSDPVRHAEVQYVEAITGLEAITTSGSEALDPDTATVLRTNLSVLDRAIGESRAALNTTPESELALSSLFEALRSKIALLQDMVALINEMRKGNSEGAARIVSGLNQ